MKKTDLDSWWDQKRGFNKFTDPLYQNFRKLCDLGADPAYIDFLYSVLLFGDAFAASMWGLKRKRRISYFSTYREPFEAIIKMTGELVIVSVLKKLQEKNLLVQSLNPWTLIPQEEGQQMAMDALREGIKLVSELNKEEDEEKTVRLMNEIKPVFERIPLLEITFKYIPEIYVSIKRGGRRLDPWGSLFLVATTEHLRERTGIPHYLVAYRFLKRVRKLRTESAQKDRRTATVRVAQFKKRFSRSNSETVFPWQNGLKLLKKEFQLKMKRNRKVPPGFRRMLVDIYDRQVFPSQGK